MGDDTGRDEFSDEVHRIANRTAHACAGLAGRANDEQIARIDASAERTAERIVEWTWTVYTPREDRQVVEVKATERRIRDLLDHARSLGPELTQSRLALASGASERTVKRHYAEIRRRLAAEPPAAPEPVAAAAPATPAADIPKTAVEPAPAADVVPAVAVVPGYGRPFRMRRTPLGAVQPPWEGQDDPFGTELVTTRPHFGLGMGGGSI